MNYFFHFHSKLLYDYYYHNYIFLHMLLLLFHLNCDLSNVVHDIHINMSHIWDFGIQDHIYNNKKIFLNLNNVPGDGGLCGDVISGFIFTNIFLFRLNFNFY